ncbi:SGNH/GDSL hydrolase family protein [Cellulophaga sp. E16_2]|uniref:SGNH/GDSL hydrolase family protein n=1 Tax=Cellulophaga sp. E16_2 TaxID=2789297 RepID=UPI001A92DD5F|nr:SGNH/GDSL hydrolase family protein [Cellulophaga sp. E16_2]MBO0590885.1 SGNH/GDSL hydrolase family protein [Cellulophaga sp. E16_2]
MKKTIKIVLISLTFLSLLFISFYLILRFSFQEELELYPIEVSNNTELKIGIIGDSWVAGEKLDSLLNTNLSKNGIEAKIMSSGHSGAKSKLIYKNMFEDKNKENSSKFIIESHPDYCIVIAGVNDAIGQIGGKFYTYHLSLIIKTLLRNNIKPIIVELPEFGISEYTNKLNLIKKKRYELFAMFNNDGDIDNIKAYRKNLNTSLEKQDLNNKIIFIDFDQICEDFDDCKEIYRADGVHLNIKGNTLLSEAIAKELIKEIR